MTRYYFDVTGMSQDRVYRIATQIRKKFPRLTEGYNYNCYGFLMSRMYSFKTLCWSDDSCFLGWGGPPDCEKFKLGVNKLGEM